ncbi:MAG: alkaline phosphatase, partial [Alphaproteobacteria bacterium]|nr:alkaline phosphatase [Alphaproteobacteria bacterium]
MRRSATTGALAAALLASAAGGALGQETRFNRIASWPVAENLPEGMDPLTETSAEIITATPDGRMLVYSDSPLGAIGMVDLTDPANPEPAGTVMLDGEPTSVAVVGGLAIVGIATSESFTDPSGRLGAVALDTGAVVASCDLGGQPDAVAVAPDGGFAAVAIENERDEDLNDGEIPQLPPGALALVELTDTGAPDCATLRMVDLTGLAEVAPSDPEPEFVDVNAAGRVLVTLQENNHVVVVDGTSGEVAAHFSAGTVDLANVDTEEEGAIRFEGTLEDVPREPDA